MHMRDINTTSLISMDPVLVGGGEVFGEGVVDGVLVVVVAVVEEMTANFHENPLCNAVASVTSAIASPVVQSNEDPSKEIHS